MKKLFPIFPPLGAVIILFIGLFATVPHNYYLFLRWYIFLYSIYLFSKTKYLDSFLARPVGIFFCAAVAIIFNPVWPFAFSKMTWRKIDLALLLIFGFLLTIYIKLNYYFRKALAEKKAKTYTDNIMPLIQIGNKVIIAKKGNQEVFIIGGVTVKDGKVKYDDIVQISSFNGKKWDFFFAYAKDLKDEEIISADEFRKQLHEEIVKKQLSRN